jgi:hypothetical protein
MIYIFGRGWEFRSWLLQSRCSNTWATPPIHFSLVSLEMGSHELFARAGLEPQSSWSEPHK